MEPSSPVEPADDGRKHASPWISRIIGVAALAAVIVAALNIADAERLAALVSSAQPIWLLFAFSLQLLTYATEAGVWSGVLSRAGHPRPIAELYALAVVCLFTNQMLPTAGVAGTVVVVKALERRGVPHPVSLAAMYVDLIGYYCGFGVAVGVALAMIASQNGLSPLVLGMAAAITLAGFGICGGILWVSSPGRELHGWPARFRPLRRVVASLAEADTALLRSPALLVRAGLFRLGNVVLDALTLWACLRAVGEGTSPVHVESAYVLGAIARSLGVLPGGLGTFEAGALVGLSIFGVSVEAGLAGVLLFRVLSFGLPMVPGVVLGRRFGREPVLNADG